MGKPSEETTCTIAVASIKFQSFLLYLPPFILIVYHKRVDLSIYLWYNLIRK
nr:MAG TPA: hypothetical protein [Caudoviricetes sp.]